MVKRLFSMIFVSLSCVLCQALSMDEILIAQIPGKILKPTPIGDKSKQLPIIKTSNESITYSVFHDGKVYLDYIATSQKTLLRKGVHHHVRFMDITFEVPESILNLDNDGPDKYTFSTKPYANECFTLILGAKKYFIWITENDGAASGSSVTFFVNLFEYSNPENISYFIVNTAWIIDLHSLWRELPNGDLGLGLISFELNSFSEEPSEHIKMAVFGIDGRVSFLQKNGIDCIITAKRSESRPEKGWWISSSTF